MVDAAWFAQLSGFVEEGFGECGFACVDVCEDSGYDALHGVYPTSVFVVGVGGFRGGWLVWAWCCGGLCGVGLGVVRRGWVGCSCTMADVAFCNGL